jgi:hypothetical protein
VGGEPGRVGVDGPALGANSCDPFAFRAAAPGLDNRASFVLLQWQRWLSSLQFTVCVSAVLQTNVLL